MEEGSLGPGNASCIGDCSYSYRRYAISVVFGETSKPHPVSKCFEEACHKVAEQVADLVIRKQRDYGHDNINAFGELGLIVRTNDKIARLRNLQGKEGITEPRIDAWRDIAGYALIALMLDEGTFNLELEKESEHE